MLLVLQVSTPISLATMTTTSMVLDLEADYLEGGLPPPFVVDVTAASAFKSRKALPQQQEEEEEEEDLATGN